jgi:hypothetical protein
VRNVRLPIAWLIAGVSLGALALLLLMGQPFTAKAQEQKRYQYKIVEAIRDTQTMQSILNEHGANGWELVTVSMGDMTEPRLIFKK